MKFYLNTVAHFYLEKDIKKYMDLGFSFKYEKEGYFAGQYGKELKPVEIEISTLEELMSLSKKVGFPIILEDNDITIYDDSLD